MKTADRRPFRFKQFSLYQDRCAMKIGTDGALLGGWAEVDQWPEARLLDIGTGTGLLALMLAQRNRSLVIDAVELDADAASQARENALASPFAEQITVHHSAIQKWYPEYQYDLIVSNPPFYHKRVHSPDLKRTKARHDEFLPLEALAAVVERLLAPEGCFSIVWPADREDALTRAFGASDMYPVRRCRVAPTPGKDFHRVLLTLKKGSVAEPLQEETLIIEQYGRAVFSAAFIALLREYYLDF